MKKSLYLHCIMLSIVTIFNIAGSSYNSVYGNPYKGNGNNSNVRKNKSYIKNKRETNGPNRINKLDTIKTKRREYIYTPDSYMIYRKTIRDNYYNNRVIYTNLKRRDVNNNNSYIRYSIPKNNQHTSRLKPSTNFGYFYIGGALGGSRSSAMFEGTPHIYKRNVMVSESRKKRIVRDIAKGDTMNSDEIRKNRMEELRETIDQNKKILQPALDRVETFAKKVRDIRTELTRKNNDLSTEIDKITGNEKYQNYIATKKVWMDGMKELESSQPDFVSAVNTEDGANFYKAMTGFRFVDMSYDDIANMVADQNLKYKNILESDIGRVILTALKNEEVQKLLVAETNMTLAWNRMTEETFQELKKLTLEVETLNIKLREAEDDMRDNNLTPEEDRIHQTILAEAQELKDLRISENAEYDDNEEESARNSRASNDDTNSRSKDSSSQNTLTELERVADKIGLTDKMIDGPKAIILYIFIHEDLNSLSEYLSSNINDLSSALNTDNGQKELNTLEEGFRSHLMDALATTEGVTLVRMMSSNDGKEWIRLKRKSNIEGTMVRESENVDTAQSELDNLVTQESSDLNTAQSEALAEEKELDQAGDTAMIGFDRWRVGGNAELRTGYEIKRDKLYFAAEAFAQKLFANTVEASFTQSNGIANSSSVSVNYLYGFKGKVGANFSDKVSAYGIVGLARTHTEMRTNAITLQDHSYDAFSPSSKNDFGIVYGVGLSYQVTPKVSLTAECQLVHFLNGKIKTNAVPNIDNAAYESAKALYSPSFKDVGIQTIMFGANFLF